MRVILEPEDIIEAIKLWIDEKGLDSGEVASTVVTYNGTPLGEQQKTAIDVHFAPKRTGPKNGPYR